MSSSAQEDGQSQLQSWQLSPKLASHPSPHTYSCPFSLSSLNPQQLFRELEDTRG